MSQYNPHIHHRRSVRLKGYDYAQAGLYFVTICCNARGSRAWLPFGNIINGQMQLNDAGQMVDKWYHELENKFPGIRCHEMVVMPNHFHCIIEIVPHVGADLRVCPNNISPPPAETPDIRDHKNETPISGDHPSSPISREHPNLPILGEHIGSPLHRVVQWFKTMTTNAYIRGVKNAGWAPFDRKLWQRNYWEHIIRDERSYDNISKYIILNPQNWENDKLR